MTDQSDIESGVSQISGQPEEYVGLNMTAKQMKDWVKEAGTVAVLNHRQRYHSHALLAAQRTVLEREAWEQAHGYGTVVSVGAAPIREKLYVRTGDHLMMPTLSAADWTRREQLPEHIVSTSCAHLMQECDCGVFDSAVFVHSAYYMPDDDLFDYLEGLTSRAAFVVGHLFEEAYGGFYEEATYQYVDERVSMKVKGNADAYVHRPLPWDVGRRLGGNRMFGVEIVRQIGATYLWRVRAIRGNQPPKVELPWREAVVAQNYYGPVQVDAQNARAILSDARNSNVVFSVDSLVRVGPVLMVDSESHRIPLPVGAIASVALYCVGRDRDPQLLGDVAHRLRAKVAGWRIPLEMQPRALCICTILGMCVELPFETNVRYTAHSRFGHWYKLHASLSTFSVPRTYSLISVFVCLFIFALISVPVGILEPDASHIGALVVILIALALFSLVWCTKTIAHIVEARQLGNWRSAVNTGETRTITSQALTEPLLMGGHSRVKPPIGVDDESGRLTLMEEPMKRTEKEPVRVLASGIVFSEVIPSVVEPSQYTEHSAVTHRYLMEKPTPTRGAMTYLKNILVENSLFQGIRDIRVDESMRAWHVWCNGLRQNEEYKKTMREAEMSTHDVEAPLVPAKTFAKIELTTKSVTRTGQHLNKMRMIQAPSDEQKARTGYVISQIYNRTVKLWDGVSSPFFYCSGATSDRIGFVVDEFLGSCGGEEKVIAFKSDCSSYDATLGEEMHVLFDWFYEHIGLSKFVIDWLNSVEARGLTPHGVQWEMNRVRRTIMVDGEPVTVERFARMVLSGEAGTNLKDTLANALTMYAALKMGCFIGGVEMPRFLMLLCGDDNMCFLNEVTNFDVIMDIGKLWLTDFGLIANIQVCQRRSEWEFCSKAFWVGRNPETGVEQTVLGGLPGRLMSRHGWFTTVPGMMNLAAKTTSLRQDNNHVPLFHDYVNTSHDLCKKQRMRANKHYEFTQFHVSRMWDISDRSIQMFEERYSMSYVSARASLRLELLKIEKLPFVLSWPRIENLIEVDFGEMPVA